MATMATAVFVTKQQPTVNIIMSITQVVLTIVADEISSLLIVVSLLKGTIWLDMAGFNMMAIRPWRWRFWSNNRPISTGKILYYVVGSNLNDGVTRM
jgi:hypothetical protein